MGRKTRNFFTVVLCVAIITSVPAQDFSTMCPAECRCLWAGGNKVANCTNASFKIIPPNLSSEIQNLILEDNSLYEIEQYAFKNVGLNNLKGLYLTKCKLQQIDKNGFAGLHIMIHLDLSKNEIKSLHPETFKDLWKIRYLILSHNYITKLENGLFSNLEQLQTVSIEDNRIVQIGDTTFTNLPSLRTIQLSANKLQHIKEDTFSSVENLSNLDLDNNPWRCDCYLQSFKNWLVGKKISTKPTECMAPPTLKGVDWLKLDNNKFKCSPIILYPTDGSVIRSSDENITLPCHISGNPFPEVNWVLNSRPIKVSDYNRGKYVINQSTQGISRWYNLTILDTDGTDNGEYVCAVKNSPKLDEAKISLFVTHASPGVSTPAVIEGNMMPVLIGICCSAAILLIILIIICYFCCRKRLSEKKKTEASNGEALIEGSVIPEMEKSLINTINPVTKPPRRYDGPNSITSGGTEMSELNKTLLDIDSVYATHDEEKHSLDFEMNPSKRSHEMLNYGRQDRAYPPDLLAFPARAPQISPAASNASTVPDTSRLPPQLNPVSPIHSPIYGTNPNLFRTLPYSRSQSPFTAPVTPSVVTPRQGYVTIPRRPRVPSWSSTASTQILPSSEAQEPLYDNLGLRTTANGSSVLSLNKSGLEQPISPMRGRPLPATPGLIQNQQTMYYTPIEEQIAQSPPTSPHHLMNPRNSISSQLSSQLSTPGPQEPTNPRMSWNSSKSSTPLIEPKKVLFPNDSLSEGGTIVRRGNKPETGSLRRNPKIILKDNNIGSPKSSPTKDDGRNNESNVSLNQTGTLGRSGKIPPRPPPKPKKKPNLIDTTNEQPIFEDEGEDGTEV